MHGSTAVIPYEPADLPAIAVNASPYLWIDSIGLADLASISRQAAHATLTRCLNGKPWRNTLLEVQAAVNGKGLQVHVHSLPRPLLEIWKARNPGIMTAPQAPAVALPVPTVLDTGIATRVAEMRWKLAIVAPALVHRKGSRARAAVIREIAARSHPGMNGTPVAIAADTLRDWLAKIEDGREFNLARPRRNDAGKRRGFVCRAWDSACPLPESEKAAIAAAFDAHVRSLWRSGMPQGKVLALAATELQKLSIESGWQDAPIIPPGLHAVKRHFNMRKLAIKETDAKRFHDLFTPRIHRSRDSLQPMDIVIGDVHPVDILITRDDGSQATPRLIAWLDLATNDLFCTVTLYPKGKSVTQADIAASFVDMVQAWGLPRTLYLDNGSEYQWKDMVSGFNALQGLAEGFRFFVACASEIDDAANIGEDHPPVAPRAIVRAKPYNAQAKAIEGAFSCLEKFMSLIPGYIGGERMKKKTHNIGKAPKPYPGSFDQFKATAFAEALAFYRNTPQGGTMADKSPNQRKQAAIDAGWRPITASREVFLFAFAQARRIKVHNGGIELDGVWFQGPAIVPKIGEYIEVRYAKWDGTHALWIDDEGKPVLIQRAEYFHPLDIAGAKHQAMLTGYQTRAMANLAKSAPRIDTVAEMARHNAALPPAPTTPPGTPIILDGESRRIVDAITTARPEPQATPARIAPAFDIYALSRPQKEKPDASADAPGFDIEQILMQPIASKQPRKETT